MRPIKFRAWDKREKKVIWVTHIQWNENDDGFYIHAWCTSDFGWVEGENFELLQYTGLHDRNGKEIYEGDVVRAVYAAPWDEEDIVNVRGEIIWEYSGWWFRCVETSSYNSQVGDAPPFEIIGNIYENPELLSTQGKEGG